MVHAGLENYNKSLINSTLIASVILIIMTRIKNHKFSS